MVAFHPRLGTEVLKIEPFGFNRKRFHAFDIRFRNLTSKRLNHPFGRDGILPIDRVIPCIDS